MGKTNKGGESQSKMSTSNHNGHLALKPDEELQGTVFPKGAGGLGSDPLMLLSAHAVHCLAGVAGGQSLSCSCVQTPVSLQGSTWA